MKEHRAKFVIELAVLTLVALPLLGIAQAPPRVVNTGAEQTNVTSIEDVQDVATRVVGWAQVFFYITATLFIVFAAFRYLTSGGDEEKVKLSWEIKKF